MIIDEFLYALGFKTDTSGAKSFVSALGGVDQASQHTTKSMLHAVTAGTLLAHGLEKARELLGELGHSFLENSEHMENARVTMEALYSTAAEGDEKFKWLWNFAQKNPVMGMEAATEVFMALKNNGIDPTTQAMKAFGDAAAAVPSVAKLIPQGIAELIEGRYHAGGVLSPLMNLHGAGKNRVYDGSYVNKAGQRVSVQLDFNNAQEATDQLIQILNAKFGGSMDAHAITWFGLTQRMKMDWVTFTQVIMGNGVFDRLKEQLSALLEQWEAFTKSDEFRRMMDDISDSASMVIELLGSVASMLGTVISLLDDINGAGGALMASSLFVALFSGAIVEKIAAFVSALKDVYAAFELVAEGENIVAVAGALMDIALSPVTLIIQAVALLAAGIGYLVMKWGEFKNGILDDGALKTFFTSLNRWFAEVGATVEYIFDKIQILFLEGLKWMGKLDANGKAKLEELKAETKDGRQAMSDKAAAKADADQGLRKRRADIIDAVAKAHPDWTGKQDLEWIKENRAATWRTLFEAPKKLKQQPPIPTPSNTASKPTTAETQHMDNSIHVANMTVVADTPEQLAANMRQQAQQTYGDHMTATANKGNGGRKPG